jgi:NAD-dependent dihydropyrimidine dehydrogenase PreA subunit
MHSVWRDWFAADKAEHRVLASAWVVPEPSRCVQCGICSFNCPMEIDVRRHVWQGESVKDRHCLTCGECVRRCPRRLLRFEEIGSAAARSTAKGL